MERAGYPPQYGPRDDERLPLRGARGKRVRVRDGGNDCANGRDSTPGLFFN